MSEEAVKQLRLRLRTGLKDPNIIAIQDVVVKAGPVAWKTAALLSFGNKETGEVSKRSLRVQTWSRVDKIRYDFNASADYRWSCEDSEIDALRALLVEHLPDAGNYEVVAEGSTAALVARLANGDSSSAVGLVAELLQLPEVRAALSRSDAVAAGSALVTADRQRAALESLQQAVLDPTSSEQALQSILDNQWWLFGGRYVGQHQRRSITALDQLDIPLIRADGSLHIVELKRAAIPNLVVPHRNHLIVGDEVHEAVNQTMNYLRELDEQSAFIQQNMGILARRTTATVVIGHPSHIKSPFTAEQVSETIRTYNSHLARVEVTTYADLIDGASAALSL